MVIAGLGLAAGLWAQDAKLEALRQILVPMRPKYSEPASSDTRDATPQFTVAKHQLRDWIESQLPPWDESFDPVSFAATLNHELKAKGLMVASGCDGDDCPRPE